MTVWKQFVADPKASLDTSCTARILGHRFDDRPDLAQRMYGSTSLFGAAPGIGPGTAPPPLAFAASTKSIDAALRRARSDARLVQIGRSPRSH